MVDDSADNVAMLSLDLQQQGYRVVTATNGEEAISVAFYTQPNLILMDISMPRLDGLGATRRIRENEVLRDVPVIAVTAFGTEGFQRAAYDVGVSGYLTKPIDFARIFTAERAAAMASNTTICVDDDLSSRDTGVALRTADDKASSLFSNFLA